jgi:hypothetical protein
LCCHTDTDIMQEFGAIACMRVRIIPVLGMSSAAGAARAVLTYITC